LNPQDGDLDEIAIAPYDFANPPTHTGGRLYGHHEFLASVVRHCHHSLKVAVRTNCKRAVSSKKPENKSPPPRRTFDIDFLLFITFIIYQKPLGCFGPTKASLTTSCSESFC